MEVIVCNVSITCLRRKIAAYATLFDCKPLLFVSGTFRDQAGELAFLSQGFYQENTDDAFRRYLTLSVDGALTKLAPLDDVIAKVKLTV